MIPNSADIVSGITVGVLAIPQSISYASIAGIPINYGLYSDLQFLYPVFGKSRYLIVGPVAVMSILSKKTVDGFSNELTPEQVTELTCFLCLAVGFCQIGLSYAGVAKKIGSVLEEIVVFSFSSCAAVLIASTQSKNVIPEGKFTEFTIMDVYFVCFVLFNFLILFLASKKKSNFGPFIVLVFGIATNYQFKFLKTIEDVPSGLPSIRWTLDVALYKHIFSSVWKILKLCYSVLLIAFLGFSEAWTIAKTVEDENEILVLEEEIEMFALGCCNIMTFFFGGYCVTGSFSRTAVNKSAGAKSSFSAIMCCVIVILCLLVLAPVLAYLPKATVSSIVIFAVSKIINIIKICDVILRLDRDTIVFFSVAVVSIISGIEFGLVVGVLTDFLLKNRINRVTVLELG